jgi:hypothetical protein
VDVYTTYLCSSRDLQPAEKNTPFINESVAGGPLIGLGPRVGACLGLGLPA